MAKAFITSGTTFSVTTDGSPITVEAIGGGGGGHPGDSNIGTGGGGGAYAVKSVAYVSGTSITVAIGAGGGLSSDGGDTSWDGGVVLSKGGQGGQGGGAGAGGAAASCVPVTGAFSGGAGGDLGSNSRAGAGGGGAAGPNGAGKAGGVGGAASIHNGAGGGGAGGGSSTAGGASTTSVPSGAGGNAQDGTVGPAGVSGNDQNGNPGTNGAGGSGGATGTAGGTSGSGGVGGNGIEFDATHGAGGGGGGGGGDIAGVAGSGGNGGLYGGGGGGGGFFGAADGSSGGQGLIVVTYVPLGSLTPASGTLAYVGGTPTLNTSNPQPSSGTLAYVGGTPTLSFSGSFSLAPAAAVLLYAVVGTQVVLHVDTGLAFYPDPAHLTYVGGTPSLTLPLDLFPAAGQLIYNSSPSGVSLVRTGGTGNQLYIGDALFACGWKESTFHITKTLSGDWSAEFQLDFFGGYDPQDLIGEDVTMIWDSVKRFGGLVQTVSEASVAGNGPMSAIPHTVLTIKVGGYQLLTDRVIVADLVTIARGGINGIVFYNIWYDKLTQFGVSKIGDQPNIECGEQLFHYITVTECFNRLKAQAPGYDWWIDDDKLLHYESTDPALGPNAPFTIRDSTRNADFMRVTKSNVRFRNRQYDLPSADLVALRDDQRLGNGVSTAFSTDFPLTAKPIVKLGGTEQLVTEFGNWIPGWQVYYVNGGIGVFFASAPPSLEVIDILYPSPFPVAEMAEDSASISTVGLYEAVWQGKNVLTRQAAQDEAQTLLDIFSAAGFPVDVEFEYSSENQPAWLKPGMIIDVDHTFPAALGNFTVEQVDSQELAGSIWKHTVTLRKGLGEVTDAQALEQFRISARVPIDSPPSRMTAELFNDIPGFTNPGAEVGPIKNTYVCQCKGVIASWDILFADDPPVGDDFWMDVLLNGVSIFPPGDGNQVVALDGVTTLQKGNRFLVDNTEVAPGDKLTLNVLQVGSDEPGANCTFHLNIKVPANSGNA